MLWEGKKMRVGLPGGAWGEDLRRPRSTLSPLPGGFGHIDCALTAVQVHG
jgi:hypothetical protein